jgi:enamine deaminase RidA (YjgF/YER057c/UK114 family)
MTTHFSAEERLKELLLELPPVPTPLGAYVESVQTGNLLFLSGMLPAVGHEPQFLGHVGRELTTEQGRLAARSACLNALATARQHLGSLERVTKVVRLGVAIAATSDFKDHPRVADAASELLESVFGKRRTATRIVLGMASLPLGMPIELEIIFEVTVQ